MENSWLNFVLRVKLLKSLKLDPVKRGTVNEKQVLGRFLP